MGDKKMRCRLWMGMAVIAGMLLSGGIARADADLGLPAGTLLASITTSGLSVANGLFEATVKSWVLDPGSLGGNDLIFAWQIINKDDSTDSLDRVTMGPSTIWGDFILVTHHTPGGAGAQAPSSHGITVGGFPRYFFDDGFGSGTLNPGEVSYILWVATNAPSFTLGTINLLNSDSLTLTSFAPSVPEPTSMLLLGTGLLGFGAFARRRLKKQKNANV